MLFGALPLPPLRAPPPTHIVVEPEGLLQVASPPTAPNQHRVVTLKRLESLLLQHLPLKQVQGLSQLWEEEGTREGSVGGLETLSKWREAETEGPSLNLDQAYSGAKHLPWASVTSFLAPVLCSMGAMW